jgi:hypothetical protein
MYHCCITGESEKDAFIQPVPGSLGSFDCSLILYICQLTIFPAIGYSLLLSVSAVLI